MTHPLLQLAERVEKADRASVELDAQIWCAVNGYEFLGWDGAGCRYRAERVGHIDARYIRNYTASIEAVLTLVPEGFRWKLGYSRHVPCVAEIVDYRIQMAPNLGSFVSECDSNHALALTAAALRARATQDDAEAG